MKVIPVEAMSVNCTGGIRHVSECEMQRDSMFQQKGENGNL